MQMDSFPVNVKDLRVATSVSLSSALITTKTGSQVGPAVITVPSSAYQPHVPDAAGLSTLPVVKQTSLLRPELLTPSALRTVKVQP